MLLFINTQCVTQVSDVFIYDFNVKRAYSITSLTEYVNSPDSNNTVKSFKYWKGCIL